MRVQLQCTGLARSVFLEVERVGEIMGESEWVMAK